MKIIRKKELKKKIGLSDSTIWRLEKSKKFPARIQLGMNSVGWLEEEVDNWILQMKRGIIYEN